MKTIKIKSFSEVPKKYTGIIELINGKKFWLLNGKKHREDGPAVEWPDGHKQYHLNGNSLNKEKIEFLINLGYPESTAIKLSNL